MEIVTERLNREHGINLIATAPTVAYKILDKEGKEKRIESPGALPEPNKINEILEPIAKATILVPQQFIGSVMSLCNNRRGRQCSIRYVAGQAELIYYLPLSEIVIDFFDRLKSVSKGYASLDYSLDSYMKGDVIKLEILLNGDKVDALAMIVHRLSAQKKARQLTESLQKEIPRQQFDVAIQAAIGGKVIARKSVKAFRKNVTEKLYGGDVTRKMKLLEKQKAGKKRMKKIGRVEVPQEAFLAVLKVND